MSNAMQRRKLFPRNATARSHAWVVGNPVTTRPESGVDNCFPGLEFDQRNLDKRFFPGLEFELHAQAVLRSIDPAARGDLSGLLPPDDLRRGIRLYAVFGTFGEPRGESRVVDLSQQLGLEAWRLVHDLEPGPVAVALGPLIGAEMAALLAAFDAYLVGGGEAATVERTADGSLRFAFARGERADYLDADGVIDPSAYRPGDLTRSLCSPWQYDFALCGCFYWASNKPDMVQKDADSPQFSNFQRRKAGGPEQVQPIASYAEWSDLDLSEPEMIVAWERLPAVFNSIEGTGIPVGPPVQLPAEDILDRAAVITALRELAPVEHGLMVEYLYAFYSVNPDAFPNDPAARGRVRSAADTVLSVAIDEMRHFRWVNEMLLTLGEPHELSRFVNLPDADHDGRFLEHTFSLKALSPARLDWFVMVEAPSDVIDVEGNADTIDGMYTRLLLSVSQGAGFSENERRRLLHLLKLIIDEGYDHFQRFTRARTLLAGLDPAAYLRLPDDPVPLGAAEVAHVFEAVADATYQQVLELLGFVLTPARLGTIDALILGAREIMYNLDEAARVATANGGAPLFRLPSVQPAGALAPEEDIVAMGLPGAMAPKDFVERVLLAPMQERVATLEGIAGGAELARSLKRRLEAAQKTFAQLR